MLALACDDCQQRSRKNPVRRDAQDVVLAGALSRAGGKKFRFRHRSSGRGAAPRIAQRRHSGRLGSQTQGGGDRPKGVVDEAIRRCAPLACLLALADHTQTSVLINELHDDDATAAGDTGEGVEIVATAGESLSGYKIHLYNGSPPPPPAAPPSMPPPGCRPAAWSTAAGRCVSPPSAMPATACRTAPTTAWRWSTAAARWCTASRATVHRPSGVGDLLAVHLGQTGQLPAAQLSRISDAPTAARRVPAAGTAGGLGRSAGARAALKARRRTAGGPLLPCAVPRPQGVSRCGSVRRRTARHQAWPRARGHRAPTCNQAPADLYSCPNQARQSPAGVPILSAACLRPHSVCCSAPAPIRPAPRGSPRSWSKNGWPRA